MWTRFAASILFRSPCNLQSRVSLFLAGEPYGTGRLIDQPERRFQLRSAYEKHNEIQYLLVDGGDDYDRGACHPGGGTATSTLQGYVPRERRRHAPHDH